MEDNSSKYRRQNNFPIKAFCLVIVFFLILPNSLAGQRIEKLEYHLSLGSKRTPRKAKKLLKLDPFNKKAIRFMASHYRTKKKSSNRDFYDDLVAKHPGDPRPFLIRAELIHDEVGLSNREQINSQKIKYLNIALSLDTVNATVLYDIASTYYNDFIYPFKKPTDWEIESGFFMDSVENKESTLDNSAEMALRYFHRLWSLNKGYHDVIYFPIKQIECHLGNVANSPVNMDIELKKGYCYFPTWYFANLEEDWKCDITRNYLYELRSSEFSISWLEEQLTDLKEPCLFNKDSKDAESFRFTWLRSFDNPIIIRIEKSPMEISLHWKSGKGAGGYAPRGLKESGEKILERAQWDNFLKFVDKLSFDTLPNEKYFPSNDGAFWTLEHKTMNGFKAHLTNHPDQDFMNACLYLLRLSGIHVDEKDIY